MILGKGDIINYEIIPKKINTANKILKSFYISEIIFFSHENIHIFNPVLLLSDLFSKTSFLKIEFIAYEIEKFKNLYKYIYKPINNIIINKRENYTLDLSILM